MVYEQFRVEYENTYSQGKNVVFDDVNMRGINLSGESIDGAVFRNVDLSAASFRHARMKNVTFVGCNLSQTDFHCAHFTTSSAQPAAVFDSCTMVDTVFDTTNFSTSLFARNTIHNTDFSGADLSNTIMKDVTWDGVGVPSLLFPTVYAFPVDGIWMVNSVGETQLLSDWKISLIQLKESQDECLPAVSQLLDHLLDVEKKIDEHIRETHPILRENT